MGFMAACDIWECKYTTSQAGKNWDKKEEMEISVKNSDIALLCQKEGG